MLLITLTLAAIGVVPLVVFTACTRGCAAFGAGGLIAGASFVSGSLLGLLFGIPRSANIAEGETESRLLAANTNLIQISDWLSKALVGASLTQLTKLPGALHEFGKTYGGDVGSPTVAVLLLVHFSVSGFLSGYLLTRIVLQGALQRADQGNISKSGSISVAEPQPDPDPPRKQTAPSDVGGTE